MSVLWALVALLSIHIGGLNGVSGQLFSSVKNAILPSLPISELGLAQLPATSSLKLPLNVPKLSASLPALSGAPVPGIPLQPKKKPQKDPSETNAQHCEASAWYFISKKNLDDYLNDTIPEIVKNCVKCADYELTGVLKMVLETTDLTSITNLTPSLGLGGDSNPLSLVTDQLPFSAPGLSQGILKTPGGSGGLGFLSNLLNDGNKLVPALGGAKNVLGQGGNSLEGKNSEDLLKSALKTIKDSEESLGLDKSEDLIKKPGSLSPNGIPGVGLGTLQDNPVKTGHLLEKLDLKLHASDIVIKNLTTITEGNSTNVNAYVEADVRGSDDLLGSVTDLMGFQLEMSVRVIIAWKIKAIKCTPFEITEKQMKVEKIKFKLSDRINREVNVVPIPLGSVIPTLLMLNATPQEGECDLTLKNPACKNEATVSAKGDLFNYHLKNANFTSKGLQISYCAEINHRNKSIPVAGGSSPPIPEDSEIFLALSASMVKALVTDVAKESYVRSKDGELKVKMLSYKLANKKAQLIIQSDFKENGVKTATVQSMVDTSHNSMIKSGYLSGAVSLVSSEHKIDPSDNEAAKEMGKQLVSKVVSNTNEDLRRMNVPLGPEIELLDNVPVEVDSQGDLTASK